MVVVPDVLSRFPALAGRKTRRGNIKRVWPVEREHEWTGQALPVFFLKNKFYK